MLEKIKGYFFCIIFGSDSEWKNYLTQFNLNHIHASQTI